MGHYKHLGDGELSLISGKGRAEYGASTVRSGEFTIPAKEAGSASWVQITFAEPMPDTNYEVEFTLSHYWDACSLIPFDKETTGFKAQVGYIQAGAGLSNRTVTYTAYKLYTDTEYNNILAAMPSNASASNKLVTESEITVIKSDTITDTVNTNGYLNTTLSRSVNVIGVISQNNSQTARVVVSDDGVKYAIQILNGTSNTPVTSGTSTVIYYYI